MILTKKKWLRRIKRLLGFIFAALLISFVLCTSAFAETSLIDPVPSMPDMSDVIPDGTNIPDSNIGGAVGSDSPFSSIMDSSANDSGSETPLMSMPDTENGTIPSTDISGGSDTSMIGENPETGDSLSRTLGIVIAVIVVLAVIMLIIALVPSGRKGTVDGPDNDKSNRFDTDGTKK